LSSLYKYLVDRYYVIGERLRSPVHCAAESTSGMAATRRRNSAIPAIGLALWFLLITSSSTFAGESDLRLPGPAPTPHGTLGERAQSMIRLFVFTAIAFVIGRLRGPRARLVEIPGEMIARRAGGAGGGGVSA
jgi:hypothetical protein